MIYTVYMIYIRIATRDDLVSIIDMGEQLQNESKDYEPLLTFDRQQSYDHYSKELVNNSARIIAAVDSDDVPVGYQYSYISVLDYLSTDNRECVLEALYVKPEYRGKSIAKELEKNAEQWAISEMKVNRIKAGIYAGNRASEHVHLKDGFVPYYIEYVKRANTNE